MPNFDSNRRGKHYNWRGSSGENARITAPMLELSKYCG